MKLNRKNKISSKYSRKKIKSIKIPQPTSAVLPEKKEMPWFLLIIGLIFRVLTVFTGVLGAALFLGNASGVFFIGYSVSPASTVLCAIIASVIITAASISVRIAIPAYSAGFILLLIRLFSVTPNIFLLISDSLKCLINTAVYFLAENGYMSLAFLITDTSYSYNVNLLLTISMELITVLMSVIIGIAVSGKLKPILASVICFVILFPVLLTNMASSSIGFALIIMFISSVIALMIFDKKFIKLSENKKIERLEKKKLKKALKSHNKTQKKELDILSMAAYNKAVSETGDIKLAKEARKAVYKAANKEKKNEKRLKRINSKKRIDELKKEKRKALIEKKAELKKEKQLLSKLKKETKKSKAARAQNAEEISRIKKRRSEMQLEHSEKAAKKLSDRIRILSFGGLASGAAMIAAFIAVIIPVSTVRNSFPVIDMINNPVSIARLYVTAYLTGDDVDLNSLDVYGGASELTPRTLSFDANEFNKTQMFLIETEKPNQIYLKSWSGLNFDFESDTWMSAEPSTVTDFRKTFGRDFSPEDIKSSYIKYILPSSAKLNSVNDYVNSQKYGFKTSQVHVSRINGESRLIFLPSSMNTDYKILSYNSLDKISAKYSNYFDGLYSSRFFDLDLKYSTVSHLSALNGDTVGDEIQKQIEYFKTVLKYIKAYEEALESISFNKYGDDDEHEFTSTLVGSFTISKNNPEALAVMLDNELREKGISYMSDSLLRRYFKMNDNERREFNDYIDTELLYRDYANKTYAETFKSEKISELAKNILSNAGYIKTGNSGSNNPIPSYTDKYNNTVSQHDVIMTVINELRENYTYTLTPTVPETPVDSVLEAFLFDTKDGYCTHFATAAAALLKEYGYSVRYCEGYIISDFTKSYAENRAASYRGIALDENAHAWIEVYYPYLGWVQYETVPDYMAAVYDSEEEISQNGSSVTVTEPIFNPSASELMKPKDPDSNKPDDQVTDIDIDIDETNTKTNSLIFILAFILIVLIILVLLIRLIWFVLKKRVKRMIDTRSLIINTAKDKKLTSVMSNNEITELAEKISHMINNIIDAATLNPDIGELPESYAVRLEEELGNPVNYTMRDVIDTMLKKEFGSGWTPGDLALMADFLTILISVVYSELSPLNKLKLRYLKLVI